MHDDFLGYFERELTFIREMGIEFAKKYPKIAGRLLLEPDRCEDPHTERLIEAFAFLCARIHKKLDDDLPELTQSLLHVLYPHYMTPFPSMSVVRFAPLLKNVPESGYVIDKGTALFSKPVDGVSCQFTTAYPVTLRPMEVVSAELAEPQRLVKGAQQSLRIRLKLHNNASFSSFRGDSLRFFLNGQAQHVHLLYQLLLNNVCHIECASVGTPSACIRALGPDSLRPVGFAEEEMLLPYPVQSFTGYRLLLEYFCFPHKFLFFDIVGLSSFSKEEFGDTIDLLVYLDKPAKHSLVVGTDTFCLHATPVVNSFQTIAEPIRVEHRKTEYRVVADLRRADGTEVLSIDEVTATIPSSPVKVKQYHPLYSLRHHSEDGEGAREGAYWHVQRRPSTVAGDSGTELFLSFSDLQLQSMDPMAETIMVRVTCSNRDLPAKLPFGDPSGDFEIETAAPVEAIKCLIKPTATLRPALGGSQQWRLISHLSLNYLSLVEGGEDALKEILALYDFDDSASTRLQIDGIVSVKSRQVTRRIGTGFCRGVEVAVDFDEEKYVGNGLYLFASVLERFLGQYVSVNSFIQLVARTVRGGEVLKQWPPRNGDRVLL